MPGFFSVFFVIVTLMVLSMFVFAFITMFRQNHRDKNSPRLTVDATVIGKRIDVSTYHHSDMHNHSHSHARSTTDYYITFQVESGDRFELMVADDIYGLIIEGDSGKLTFQGSRMLSFDRT